MSPEILNLAKSAPIVLHLCCACADMVAIQKRSLTPFAITDIIDNQVMHSLLQHFWSDLMPSLSIRNIPEEVHAALRLRAAANNRSMAAEVRNMLLQTLPLTRENAHVRAVDSQCMRQDVLDAEQAQEVEVRVKRQREALRQRMREVQTWALSLPGHDHDQSVVDELIESRRAEAKREENALSKYVSKSNPGDDS